MQKSILLYQTEILEPARNGERICLASAQIKWEYGANNEIEVTTSGTVRKGYIGLKTEYDLSKGTIYIKYTDKNVIPPSVFQMLKPEDCDCIYEIDNVTNEDSNIVVSLKTIKGKDEEIIFIIQ